MILNYLILNWWEYGIVSVLITSILTGYILVECVRDTDKNETYTMLGFMLCVGLISFVLGPLSIALSLGALIYLGLSKWLQPT